MDDPTYADDERQQNRVHCDNFHWQFQQVALPSENLICPLDSQYRRHF